MKRVLGWVLWGILVLGLALGFGEEPVPEILLDTDAEPVLVDRISGPVPELDFSPDARILEIWFPNVLNADEAILIYEGHVWLIDCGDERMGGRGAELLKRLGVTRVEKVINSHPHHDHLNGLKATDMAAKVGELLFCFSADNIHHANSLKNFKNALAYAGKNDIAVSSYKDGDVLEMGDGAVTMTCYANTEDRLDVNNRSGQILLRYGERTILFMADMEKPGQEAMLERVGSEAFRADLLKYPHHGKSAMADAFLEAVDPKAVIITNKKVEDWKGVRYLKKKQIPYYYTAVYKTTGKTKKPLYLHLATDGKRWVLERVAQDDVKEIRTADEP